MQTTPLTIQDARRIAKTAMRAQYGADWWKRDDADTALRPAIAKAARLIIAQQNAERTVPETAPEAVLVVGDILVPIVPEAPKAPVVPVTEPEALAALRVEAWKLFPSDRTQPSTSKANKKLAMQRRAYLLKHGAPKVALKPGQVVFGKVIA